MKTTTAINLNEIRNQAKDAIQTLSEAADKLPDEEKESLRKSIGDLLEKYGAYHSDPDFLKDLKS